MASLQATSLCLFLLLACIAAANADSRSLCGSAASRHLAPPATHKLYKCQPVAFEATTAAKQPQSQAVLVKGPPPVGDQTPEEKKTGATGITIAAAVTHSPTTKQLLAVADTAPPMKEQNPKMKNKTVSKHQKKKPKKQEKTRRSRATATEKQLQRQAAVKKNAPPKPSGPRAARARASGCKSKPAPPGLLC